VQGTPRLGLRHYALLAVAALLLLLPGLALLPPIDRDESRYMEATSQMLGTGNFIDVRFQDRPRYLQPAGIYWLEAASVSLFSTAEARQPWAYRLPSLVGAVGAVLLTGWIGSTLFGGTAGLVAALLLACSVLLSVEARMATIDATLLAAVLTAQAALLRVYLQRDDPAPPKRGVAALYWVALGAGVMLKGPVILLVSWGTILGLLAVERRGAWLRRLHPKWGIPLMLAVVAPWCIAIAIVSHGAFFENSVGQNFLGKVAQGQQAHGLPPGYYLTVFAPAFWPGSLFAVLALPFAWANRRRPEVRFLLAWILPTWIVFELAVTKLPHYVLPTYPAIACLTAAAAVTPGAWRIGWTWRLVRSIYGAVWLAVACGLAIAGPLLLWTLQRTIGPVSIIAAVAVIGLAVAGFRLTLRGRPLPAMAVSGAAALVLFASSYALVLPNLTAIWLAPRIAAAVSSARRCPDSVVASSSFSEPSLVFAVGQDTKLVNAVEAADFLVANRACGLALIGTRDTAPFYARMQAAGVTPVPRAAISGVNYSTGGRLELTLYQAGKPL